MTYLKMCYTKGYMYKTNMSDLLNFDTPQTLGLPHNIALIPPPSKDSQITPHTS